MPKSSTDNLILSSLQDIAVALQNPAPRSPLAEYKELSQSSQGKYWGEANGEDVGRLFQGLGPTSAMPTGTNTMFFIEKNNIPKHKKTAYIRVVCANRSKKTQPR
jgi:hypothetical protein